MRSIVNAQSDWNDDDNAGHDVDGDIPKVHEPHDINLEQICFKKGIQTNFSTSHSIMRSTHLCYLSLTSRIFTPPFDNNYGIHMNLHLHFTWEGL